MSAENELNEVIEETKESAQFKPFLDGMVKTAEKIVETEKKVDEVEDKIGKKIDRGLEDLENKVNKSVEDILERINQTRDATLAYQRTSGILQPILHDNLKEVLSDEIKKDSRAFEVQAAQLPESVKLHEPEIYMATHEWFLNTTKAQLPKYAGRAGEYARRADKIYQAMQDIAGATGKANPLQEDTDGEGGYLVPTLVEGDVMRLVGDSGKIWPLCRQAVLKTKTTNFPNEATAISVNWISEEGSLTGGEPVFGQTAIEAEKLAGRATLSLELLQDSAVNLLPWLLSVFTEKMARELDYQVILGDGTTTELLGVMNGSGINAVTDSTQTHLTWPHLVKCFTGASEQTARDDGVWFCSPKGYAEILSLKDDNGMPIVHHGTFTQQSPAGTILGRPIVPHAAIGGSATLDNTTLTKTDIVFGPPKTFIAGTRIGMQWDVTDQVGWANYRADCRLIGRFGGRVGVPAAWSYVEVSYT